MIQAQPSRSSPLDLAPGAGLPGDRGACLAARQAFVSLKRSFLEALEVAPTAEWLRAQVRAAEEPVDLWLLRAPVFAALDRMDPDCRAHRQRLHRSLDSIFPDLEESRGLMPLPTFRPSPAPGRCA